jgi:hypothetical protein
MARPKGVGLELSLEVDAADVLEQLPDDVLSHELALRGFHVRTELEVWEEAERVNRLFEALRYGLHGGLEACAREIIQYAPQPREVSPRPDGGVPEVYVLPESLAGPLRSVTKGAP